MTILIGLIFIALCVAIFISYEVLDCFELLFVGVFLLVDVSFFVFPACADLTIWYAISSTMLMVLYDIMLIAYIKFSNNYQIVKK